MQAIAEKQLRFAQVTRYKIQGKASPSFSNALRSRRGDRSTYSFSNERNSERVRASSLKVPSRHDVFMIEFCFSTPRIIMQRCFASTTTATPDGSRQFMSDSAI